MRLQETSSNLDVSQNQKKRRVAFFIGKISEYTWEKPIKEASNHSPENITSWDIIAQSFF